MMQTVHTINEVHELVSQSKRQGKKVAFVPTMGNLHPGHISLVKKATEIADFVVSSIFVNPLQFCAGEDYNTYPRTLKEDQEKLAEANCDLLFAPTVNEMYPNGNESMTQVTAPAEITDTLCGLTRPGHFAGVTTVVAKLFGIAQPDIAIFGKKDFQQLAVIRRMSQDLSLPIEIIGMPTAREDDDLAMSSRNSYLSSEERAKATAIIIQIKNVRDIIVGGNKEFKKLEAEATSELEKEGFEVDYFAIRQQDTLQDAAADDSKLVILAAAKLGTTRLIDNLDFVL